MVAGEQRVRNLDYQGQSTVAERGVTLNGGNRGYFIDRGLERVNTYVDRLPFGRIEENIHEAITAKRSKGDRSPVRILTIGPGKGRLETELKALFGNDIVIDVFSLTSILTPQARAVIRREFIGNLNLHDFPQAYDRIISICAADHAVDPSRVIQQVARALLPDGEAIFTVGQKQVPGKADYTGMATREYLIDHGIHLAWHMGDPNTRPIRVVYLHKGPQGKDFEWPGDEVLSTTSYRYQLTKGGEYFIYPGEKAFRMVVQERLRAILKEGGLELGKDRKSAHFLDWLATTLITFGVEHGIPIDDWIRRHIEESEKGDLLPRFKK